MAAAPRRENVVILGHSYINHLVTFLQREQVGSSNIAMGMGLEARNVQVEYLGRRGAVVRSVLSRQHLDRIKDVHPRCMVLHIGGNDITSRESDPVRVATDIVTLASLLHWGYDVDQIAVCQLLCREQPRFPEYNDILLHVNASLQQQLEGKPWAFYWKHRGMWNPGTRLHAADGVHLNSRGNYKFYTSLRTAVIHAVNRLQ